MAISYDWKLNLVEIEWLPQTNEGQLIEIHWGCVATDDQSGEIVGDVGSINVRDENYIYPAATIKNTTKAQIFTFLNNKLGDEKEEIKASLAAQLAQREIQDSFVPTD